MSKHNSTIVPSFVMRDERNIPISKLLRPRQNQLISMKQMRKPNISLAIGTRLNSKGWNTKLQMQEVLQNVPDVLKIELFFWKWEKASNRHIIVMLLNTPRHHPCHRWASWNHGTLGSRWQKRPWIKKLVGHCLRRMHNNRHWGFFSDHATCKVGGADGIPRNRVPNSPKEEQRMLEQGLGGWASDEVSSSSTNSGAASCQVQL